MFGADFLCLLPLHSAAGIGDRCTRRRIAEQDGDIFTSSFEHKMPPFKCKGAIGVLRVPHMMVKVINLVSGNTYSERAELVKKKRELFHQNRRKNLCSSTFHLKSLAFQYIFSCEPSASPEMLFLVPSSVTRDFPAGTMLPAAPTK